MGIASLFRVALSSSSGWSESDPIEIVVDDEAVSHTIDFEIAGVSGVDLVYDFGDGLAVRPAHYAIARSVNDEDGFVDLLPGFAEVQGL